MNPEFPRPIPIWVYDFRHIIEIRQRQGYQFYISGTLTTDASDIAVAIYLGKMVHSVKTEHSNRISD